MKRIVKKFLSNLLFFPAVSRLYIRPILKLHNFTYMLSSKVSAIISPDGLHPKHGILKYKEWFKSNIKPNDVVLDVGSNTGELPVFLSNKAKYVYGIEIVESLYNKALENTQPNIQFILGDATKYTYEDMRPISVVTLSNVLEHIEHRVDFLKDILKGVPWEDKLNKKILIRVPMINRDWITIYKRNMGVEWRLDSTHFIEYTMEGFNEELRQAGITIVESAVRYGEIYAICQYTDDLSS